MVPDNPTEACHKTGKRCQGWCGMRNGAGLGAPWDGWSPRVVSEDVEDHAARRPDFLAVQAAGLSLTYGQLNAMANRIAQRLVGAGAGAESPVGVCLERSPRLLAALLAVFKSAASAVLVDPDWPAEALQRVLTMADPRLVLGSSPVPPFPALRSAWVCIGGEVADGPDAGNPGRAIRPDAVACWVATSGSTGTPKIVGVTHRALAHRARTHGEGYRIRPGDRSSWLSPPGASVSAVELWPFLAAGGSVHVPPAPTVAAADELRDWLVEQRIDKAFVPMPVGEALLTLPWAAGTALRLLTVGGDSVRVWPPDGLPFEVAVEYGSAEANGVTSCLVPWEDRYTSGLVPADEAVSPPPIGRPWPDVEAWVLDDMMRPLPDGQTGELYVGSPELARGYLNQPAETALRFVPHPWREGARLYRTGDLVRRGPSGLLFHCGRVDAQVKILGQRVEPAEVEAVLLRQPEVAAAVVVARPDPHGDPRLVAYLVPRQALDAGSLRSRLRSHLPAHMVPSRFEPMTELPRNEGGKVDRRRLPEPAWSRREERSDATGPALAPPAAPEARDPIGSWVANEWAAELGLAPVSMADDFLSAGGDSMRASRLVSRAREHFGVPVRLREFVREPTPEALCRTIRDAISRHGPAPADQGGPVDAEIPHPNIGGVRGDLTS